MPMAVVNPPLSATDRALPVVPPVLVTDAVAKDAIISWYGGEFAAANAIIDALCRHLAQLGGGGSEYEAVFTAVHRRRINWIPVLQMQKYHSIADVAAELSQLAARKLLAEEEKMIEADDIKFKRCGNFVAEDQVKEKLCLDDEKKEEEFPEKMTQTSDASAAESVNGEVIDEEEDDSPNSEITDSGSQEVHTAVDNIDLCTNHEDCDARSSQIKLTKCFSAKEPVRGHMVNVVKGLKLYENVFTDSELSKLSNYVKELRSAGQNRELNGETYILFNKQMKGNKRELLQFGVPIFGHIQDQGGAASNYKEIGNIDPIPALLQDVVDHLVQWQLLPLYKKPNSCIVNFFDKGEHSQPFLKPPHLDQPVSTLFLNESPVVFGRFLVSDGDGNYKGPLMLHLKQGSLLVMRGRSADVARHVMCPSPSKRVSITFFRVRSDSSNPTHHRSPTHHPSSPPPSGPVSLYQPAISTPYNVLNGAAIYEGLDIVPHWGYTPMPLLMLAPVNPPVLCPQNLQPGGTGVFLPWNGSARKPARRLLPRARRGRLPPPQPAVGTQVAESAY